MLEKFTLQSTENYVTVNGKIMIKHIKALSTRNATSLKINSHKFSRRPRTGALRLVHI
jgi:hypothetical protein